jgi:1-acyl-sn-glycerol-3-phosphate acyltransferase
MRRGRRSVLGAWALAAWIFGSALVLGVICLPSMLMGRRAALAVARLWARGVLGGLRLLVGARVEVRGLEHVPNGACLVAAKHQGMLDILVAVLVLPDPCIILKRELMGVPIFGWYARATRMIPIHRGGGAATVKLMTEAAARALADGRQVLIYPEGTRREPGAEPAYKSGVAAMYRELQVPCAVLATNSGLVWPPHGMAKHAGLAVFEFLPPLGPGLRRGTFMAGIEARIEAGSNALLAES